MSQFPHPHLLDNAWRDIDDPARGRRRVRFDEQGRIVEARLADGRTLLFRRDADGMLRRVESNALFVAIDPADGNRLSVSDPEGVTTVGWEQRAVTVERDGNRLWMSADRRGRITRVEMPGSERALGYHWDDDGNCSITAESGAPVFTVTQYGPSRRMECAAGGWDEQRLAGGVRMTVLGPEPRISVEVERDLLGRTGERVWSDGTRESFQRDGDERMSRWTRTGAQAETRTYEYSGEHLSREARDGVSITRTLDEGGRVLSLARAGGERVEYEYDVCGRRTARVEGGRRTAYTYDVLGQLIAVDGPDGARTAMQYDGLGRRVRVGGRYEHRDGAGRLWSVTDARGKALHSYVWFENRLVARIDGPVGEVVTEAFLCDGSGTLLGTLSARGFERNTAGPYGSAATQNRPTLYGHLADAVTGLIHFGAREFDPETGCFLTPDPWHGAEDDPRRWGGESARQVEAAAEIPRSGIHPYSLAQFDPAGRIDADGHKASLPSTALSVVNGIATFLLAPTWGMPLTAISLFFFLPIDLYMDVIGLLVTTAVNIFGSGPSGFWLHHPWENHSIFRSTFLMGSSRQGVVAFGLNGFLPRVISGKGPSSDRAVTIGNVVWINRAELNRMERPSVLEFDNLTGLNVNPSIRSMLHIRGTAAKRDRFYAAYWTRGYGNTIAVTPPAGGVPELLTFTDAAPAGGGAARSLVHLMRPIPFEFPTDKPATLDVTEYLYTPPGAAPPAAPGAPAPFVSKRAVCTLVVDQWFSVKVPKGKLHDKDVIEVTFKDAFMHSRIAEVVPDESSTEIAILFHPLPGIKTDDKFNVNRVVDKAPPGAETPGWAQSTSNKDLTVTIAAADAAPGGAFAGFILREKDVIRITPPPPPPPAPPAPPAPPGGGPAPPAPPAPPPGAPPAPLPVYARVKTSKSTLKLTAALPAAAKAGSDVFKMAEHGTAGKGKYPDPAAPENLKLTTKGSISEGDVVSIRSRTPDKAMLAKVKTIAGDDMKVELLSANMNAAAGVDIEVKRLKALDSSDNTATVVTAAADSIQVTLGPTAIFAAKSILRFSSAADKELLSELDFVSQMDIEITDGLTAAGPYKIALAKVDETLETIKGAQLAPAMRFLKHTAGNLPSAFGAYPQFLINIGPLNLIHAFHQISSSFALTAPATFDADFHYTWKVVKLGLDEYFVLNSDLPVDFEVKKNNATPPVEERKYRWGKDPDSRNDTEKINFKTTPSAAPILVEMEVIEYSKAAFNKHPLAIGEARALIPENPLASDTHADALREHELHHAQQNTHWGAFMGALPIGGLQTIIVDAQGTKNGPNPPSWLVNENAPADAKNKMQEFQGVQWASVGALMELAWTYLFFGGLYASKWSFKDWNRIFNPVFGNIIAALKEQVDPNEPLNKRPEFALLQLLATLTDLRSWIPFIGWVPLILPDGPRSFLEQGASRASGDLYSTILSADDKFNRVSDTRSFLPDIVPDYHTANLSKGFGDVTRMMVFPGHREDHMIPHARSNRPDWAIVFCSTFAENQLVSIRPQTDALFHPELFEQLFPAAGGVAAFPTQDIDGPASNAAKVSFLKVPAAGNVGPRLRAFTPLPARVSKGTGFYFIPGSPAVYDFKAYWDGDNTIVPPVDGKPDFSNDASTQDVTLTIRSGVIDADDKEGKIGEVTFAGDKVVWAMPPAAGAAGPASAFDCFPTEKIALRVTGQPVTNKQWELNLLGAGAAAAAGLPALAPAGIAVAAITPDGWDVQIAGKAGLGAAPAAVTTVRARMFRIFKKNDSADDANNDAAFDLVYPDKDKDHPELKNIRSFLDKDLWIVVRDFVFSVKDMPELTAGGAAATIKSDEVQKLDLGVKLEGESRPLVTPLPPGAGVARPVPAGAIPAPGVERIKDVSAHKRGEMWQVKALGGLIEEDAVYDVTVEFGKAPNTYPRKLKLTIQPAIRLKDAAATPFEAAKDKPCTLNIEGGNGTYEVETGGYPDGTAAKIVGVTVVITVTKAPAADTKVVVKVSDGSSPKKEGRRTITIKKA